MFATLKCVQKLFIICKTFIVVSAFRNRQSKGNAVKRLQKVLLNSARKSRQAVSKLAHVGVQLAEEVDADERPGRQPIANDTVEKVQTLYLRDDISRQAASMKGCRCVKEKWFRSAIFTIAPMRRMSSTRLNIMTSYR